MTRLRDSERPGVIAPTYRATVSDMVTLVAGHVSNAVAPSAQQLEQMFLIS
jgi:hypothetical protein